MADSSNILVVSDLHFGEELLPGATAERRHAVDLGAEAFREFLRYHAVRRIDGRPWRLVIAGDLYVWKLVRRDMQRPIAEYRAIMERMLAAAVGVTREELFAKTGGMP